MMDESLARFHPKPERISRGLRQPGSRIKAQRLQHNANNLPSSAEIDLEPLLHALSYQMKCNNRNPVTLHTYSYALLCM
ncbi:unnamed protein product [Protopolystoma xenopodis]|uniref:Uncharacterized protein n=1 Tax=Protopolystoma xenopodis TaxID=117903 RepID=A0A448WQI2_9PLAT|nr:unnamed protein product [Protopolystoma xenopodis]